MPIVSHGIDLVEVPRIAQMLENHADHFKSRCFTPAEQAYCDSYKRSAAMHFAGRFAVKEAVLKCLGTGWRGQIQWTDVETLNDPSGKPLVTLSGESARIAESLGISRWHISISHSASLAIASAIAEA